MCAGGEESEVETFRRILQTYPTGVVSIVSDTWDYWDTITTKATELKDDILNRQPDSLGLAKCVFRPDSGDPVKIICGDPDAPVGSPEYKGSVVCLDEIFGSTVNAKGYKTLNPRVGLIYGDSITYDRAERILSGLAAKGYASDNIVFGIGSYTFQYNTRDTLGIAMKATYVEINGVGKAIFKNPKTDDGTKKSAKGLLRVERIGDNFVLVNDVNKELERGGCLRTVFLNGEAYNQETFADIRSRLGSI
jgi:nicotinamide phosphoribosyltransferase